ncbi:16S rRNA (cytosine(1402)-N(4))-methyltransferase RsmH [Telmatocola sphagniphila]|uniref:Ribosomal RNA small subunit methyltransferase H n=1 Tax=Telmatocola sphagniphila TaxID=1123043 RepID=A0A8E6B334_9BACT|nr:16S rRNA (cytosine(1402)-N(4))-methyltransferase RsmH [Telmatocola sphagniphila]QVL30539.1 16S rRNA (cytosine(1402)-N(4))-methyltransferase RsmH [Telmatocola sphagniphila]
MHRSVLPIETLELLAPASGEVWIDATAGLGGHSRLIAEKLLPGGMLIALDQDPSMLALAKENLKDLPVRFFHANFDQFEAVLEELKLEKVNGLLADLGICSEQLDDPQRGLSFQKNGPLDMRLDTTTGRPAADLVNRLEEEELADIFYHYGEERLSRRVARRIVEQRAVRKFETTEQLAELVRRCVPRSPGQRIDPATRVFQALRIAVNEELAVLENLLRILPRRIAPGGRVGIISFHSLEDRPVKQAFADKDIWESLTRKPVQAGEEECRDNPRSRSAKLRVVRRKA